MEPKRCRYKWQKKDDLVEDLVEKEEQHAEQCSNCGRMVPSDKIKKQLDMFQ